MVACFEIGGGKRLRQDHDAPSMRCRYSRPGVLGVRPVEMSIEVLAAAGKRAGSRGRQNLGFPRGFKDKAWRMHVVGHLRQPFGEPLAGRVKGTRMHAGRGRFQAEKIQPAGGEWCLCDHSSGIHQQPPASGYKTRHFFEFPFIGRRADQDEKRQILPVHRGIDDIPLDMLLRKKLGHPVYGVEERRPRLSSSHHGGALDSARNQNGRLAGPLHADAPWLPRFEKSESLPDCGIHPALEISVAVQMIADAGAGTNHEMGGNLELELAFRDHRPEVAPVFEEPAGHAHHGDAGVTKVAAQNRETQPAGLERKRLDIKFRDNACRLFCFAERIVAADFQSKVRADRIHAPPQFAGKPVVCGGVELCVRGFIFRVDPLGAHHLQARLAETAARQISRHVDEDAVHRIVAQALFQVGKKERFQPWAAVRAKPSPVKLRAVLKDLRVCRAAIPEHGDIPGMRGGKNLVHIEAEVGEHRNFPLGGF